MLKKTLLFALLCCSFLFLPQTALASPGNSIVLYGTDTCRVCTSFQNVFERTLNELVVDVDYHYIDVRSSSGSVQYNNLIEAYSLPRTIPLVAINENVVYWEPDELERLKDVEVLNSALERSLPNHSRPASSGLTLSVIMLAGLFDGINPCALAMLIFLMAYIRALGKGDDVRKKILAVGWIYATGTFITYFMVGAGLATFLLYLSILPLVARIIYAATILMCLFFAYQSLLDFWRMRNGGDLAETSFLPERLRRLAHRIVRRKISLTGLYLSTFVVSILISLLEFACTGQVYLPTITFLLTQSPGAISLYGYLVVYNLMFCVPILVVVYSLWFGSRVQEHSHRLARNLKYIRLASFVFFLLMALYIISVFPS